MVRRLRTLKQWLEPVDAAAQRGEELAILTDLACEEEDQATLSEVETGLADLEQRLERLDFQFLLSGEDDGRGAILEIHPGAGGTESQDWAEMLLRMYTRYLEDHGMDYKTIDLLAGEEAGIKSAALEIDHPFAYGYLKSESGVHRLVRISPFDAQKRRHTSFA